MHNPITTPLLAPHTGTIMAWAHHHIHSHRYDLATTWSTHADTPWTPECPQWRADHHDDITALCRDNPHLRIIPPGGLDDRWLIALYPFTTGRVDWHIRMPLETFLTATLKPPLVADSAAIDGAMERLGVQLYARLHEWLTQISPGDPVAAWAQLTALGTVVDDVVASVAIPVMPVATDMTVCLLVTHPGDVVGPALPLLPGHHGTCVEGTKPTT